MKRLGTLIAFLVIVLSVPAQTVLLNVDRKEEQKIVDRGPNLKRFTCGFFRFGLLASPDHAGARIIYGNSIDLAFGLRKKYKVSSVYSLGFEMEGRYTDYKFKQSEGKIIPDTLINNISQRLDYSTFGLGFYNRFNLDPHRGNYLGTFIDVGIMGDIFFTIEQISKNKMDNGTTVKSITTNLDFVNHLNTRVYGRIGFSHFSLYGSYRLMDLFKKSSNYPDLPRLVLGVELAIF